MDTETVAALRRKHISNALSLSYKQPLHIVRGRGRLFGLNTRVFFFVVSLPSSSATFHFSSSLSPFPGQYLYDKNGVEYLDVVNNVAHVGHCHPLVTEAATRQMHALNTNTRYYDENLAKYAQKLTSLFPEPLSVVFFVNSGSEANDLAIRLAKAATGGTDIITLASAYHGHTQVGSGPRACAAAGACFRHPDLILLREKRSRSPLVAVVVVVVVIFPSCSSAHERTRDRLIFLPVILRVRVCVIESTMSPFTDVH